MYLCAIFCYTISSWNHFINRLTTNYYVTSLFGTVLAALLLIPTVLHAASIRPTLTFLDATDSVVSRVEATLGETFTASYLTSDVREILRSVSYTSTNETVATVDALGNVTLVAAGTMMILLPSAHIYRQ